MVINFLTVSLQNFRRLIFPPVISLEITVARHQLSDFCKLFTFLKFAIGLKNLIRVLSYSLLLLQFGDDFRPTLSF